MKKPTPPFSGSNQIPAASNPTGLPFSERPSAQSIDPFSMPVEPPSNFLDIISMEDNDIYLDDAIIEARDSSVGAANVHEGFQKKCIGCVNYWSLETLAPVKNTRTDGSPFTKREEYCIFSDKLFALSEREVFTCTRFTAKKA